MDTYNVQEARKHFSAILAMVSAGKQVVIEDSGKAIAIISPPQEPPEKRPFGKYKGQVIIENAFFDPMDDDFMSHFR